MDAAECSFARGGRERKTSSFSSLNPLLFSFFFSSISLFPHHFFIKVELERELILLNFHCHEQFLKDHSLGKCVGVSFSALAFAFLLFCGYWPYHLNRMLKAILHYATFKYVLLAYGYVKNPLFSVSWCGGSRPFSGEVVSGFLTLMKISQMVLFSYAFIHHSNVSFSIKSFWTVDYEFKYWVKKVPDLFTWK